MILIMELRNGSKKRYDIPSEFDGELHAICGEIETTEFIFPDPNEQENGQ